MTKIVLLWHGDQAIGICVFASPAASISLRTRFFGLKNPLTRLGLQALNKQLWVLQRVVLHPTYRGAGVAAEFVSRACDLCPVPWIETLSAMARVNPFFERAGFRKLGVIRKTEVTDASDPYRYSEPGYYIRERAGEPAT